MSETLLSPAATEAASDRTTAPNGVVAIEPVHKRIKVSFAGQTVIDTGNAVYLLEKGHTPTYYLPLADVNPDLIQPVDTSSVCPRKGTARYWDIVVGDKRSADAIWSYPNHYDDALDLSDYVAFYWDRVDEWLVDGEKVTSVV